MSHADSPQLCKRRIRTAIVGLSAHATTSWAAQTHLPCLLCPAGQTRFAITALLNSSVEAAEAAVVAFGLDGRVTKAYGDVADLARDPEVDLAIVATRVDRHHTAVRALIAAGKDVYIEWPVTAEQRQTDDLVREAALAAGVGVKVAVGLQGRWAAPILQLGRMLSSHEYGKLLSCHVLAYGGTKDRAILPVGLRYFAQREIGGNPVTIGFAHVSDFVQSLVGELDPDTTSARLQIQRPRIPIQDPETFEIIEEVESNVPDLISVHGAIPSTAHVVEEATLVAHFRRGQPFPGQPALKLSLVCEKAEIVLYAPSGVSLQAGAYDEEVTIHVHNFATDKMEAVTWAWEEVQLEVPIRARSVQSCLFALADGREDGWVNLHDAAARARQINSWLHGSIACNE